FYDQPERLQEAFQHLRFKGHDLVAFQVLDQNELDFDFKDPVVLLEDAETQEQMPVLPDVVMGGYRERMRNHVEGMRRCAAANNVDYEMLTTKQPLDFALLSFLSRLFFLGVAALAAPILVHLVRRTRARKVQFPALVFVRQVPQRTIRR